MENKFMWGDESFDDIVSGKQQTFTNKEYYLNDITGIIDIGKVRKNQEDSLLMMENGGAKLMAISDGMGGFCNGGIASNYALLTIGLWFKEMNITENYSEIKLLEELKKILIAVGQQVRVKYYSGATLVIAVKLKDNTITMNVGDSRIYMYSNNQLLQISEDQSYGWDKLNSGEIRKKDDLRFYPYNNIIDCYLGGPIKFDNLLIDNDDYSDLLLFSDGVTDLISDEKMAYFISRNRENYEKDILNYIMNVTDYNYYLDDIFYKTTTPGKDNASMIIYRKK